jgi:general secretion pathway protein L
MSALHRALTREINLGSAASGALGWWAGELRSLLGGRFWERLLGAEPIVIEQATGAVRLGERRVDPSRLAARQRADVVLELPASEALVKTLHIPAAAEADLQRLVTFEIGRLTPFGAEHAYFAHEKRRRNADGSLELRVTVVAREPVDATVADLAARGFSVRHVQVAGSAANLVPALAARPMLWTGLNRALLVLLLLAAAAAAAAPIATSYRRAAALDAQIAALRPAADAASREREARGAVAARQAEIARTLASTASPLAVLDALTKAIPDGSYLTSFSLSGREVLIDGLSPAAAGLPQALEAMPGVLRVSYRAPVVRDAASGLERFQFSLLLGKRGT